MFRARMAYCGPRGIPLSRFLSWPVEDQEAALAWQDDQSRSCSRCGTHPDEWDEKGANAYHVGRHVCRGCMALARANDEAKPGPNASIGDKQMAAARQFFLAPGPPPTG